MTVTVKLAFGRVIAITNRNITTKTMMADSNKEEKKNLQIGMTIESISDFNLKQSNFKATISLLMVVEKSGRPPGSVIVRYDQYLYPFSDLQFTGNKVRPKDAYRLLISASDGTTSTRSNYELEIHCPFNLKQYPFDSHYCPIDIYTGKHPSRKLSLSWYYSDGARLNASIRPVSMHTSLISSESCNFEGIYAVTELNTASARFSCLRVRLHFYRPFHASFFRYFLPTIILVALTWIIFYIERQRLQSRITIVAFSSLLTFFCAMLWNNEVPSTAYLTAADIWVFLCNIFILLSLLEVITVHILMKMSHKQLLLANKNESVRAESRHRRERQAAKRGRSISPRPLIANGRMFEMKHLDQDLLGSTSTSNYDTLINDYFHRWSDYYSVTAARVDLSARIILPLAYGIVVSLYFSFYLFL
ncbi:Neurotransmitter-gated ion-channel transmembrane region family protein [Acanthocheilonema viteae]